MKCLGGMLYVPENGFILAYRGWMELDGSSLWKVLSQAGALWREQEHQGN